MRLASIIVTLSCLTGCMAGMHGALRDSSIGQMPCSRDEIEVDVDRDFHQGSQGWTWEASCRGVRYSCARNFTGSAFLGGVSSETHCAPITAPPAPRRESKIHRMGDRCYSVETHDAVDCPPDAE